MNVEQETLGLRRAGFSPALTLLMSAFALLIPPAVLAFAGLQNAPLPLALLRIRGFGY